MKEENNPETPAIKHLKSMQENDNECLDINIEAIKNTVTVLAYSLADGMSDDDYGTRAINAMKDLSLVCNDFIKLKS